ncbi:sigma factor-like helix-turn-helix DNA-binding protein [Calothrix sp. UHCC 0171]|uniref:sigma factor-like helix-turn-helix DNA-binding protein n=1 Tax=Calothrix sp. UHCC 0171 TaxID=3110245 RepID=UPI002B219E9B|nr:sigma factor-like helix-turn-helix DNA-binding protein [Calothrix sp. UHCC 0171]MEA5572170.1 sigma factor-like helix-turn-helix DNA-binding protein [Calothrix sp. UHCC 0171]
MIELTENRSPLILTKPMRAKLFASFLLRLTQFGLKDKYTPDDIFTEVVRRLELEIESGKIVYNREAWLRTAGFEYIYQLKCNEKMSSINGNAMTAHITSCSVSFGLSQRQKYSQILQESILQLEPGERKLLEMKFYQHRSWEEIAEILSLNGEKITAVALRQRGCRAMRSLRKLYKHNL